MLKQTYNQHSIDILKQEINMLRSLIIGTVGKDKEGNYNPDFVKNIIRNSQEKPIYVFKGQNHFLKLLK